jgi:5'-methylthioadenosine phosphorylase
VNYRANLWALHHLGVRQVLGPCAVGSLRAELKPGTILTPDQYVDRTWGRAHTVYDEAPVVHVSPADPYCAAGRAAVIAAGNGSVVAEGTMVVINGPRFSTRAESRWHAAQGWSVVGMTGAPEASIARELALCYTSIAVVTDHDAGVDAGEGVTHAEVLEVFGRSIDRLKHLLAEAIAQLPKPDADCPCRHSLDGTAGEDLW